MTGAMLSTFYKVIKVKALVEVELRLQFKKGKQ